MKDEHTFDYAHFVKHVKESNECDYDEEVQQIDNSTTNTANITTTSEFTLNEVPPAAILITMPTPSEMVEISNSQAVTPPSHIPTTTTETETTPTLINPITVLVKFIDLHTGKELYCTFIRIEKSMDTLGKLEDLLLQRWNAKASGSISLDYPPLLGPREHIRNVQLKSADRFNNIVDIDLDNHFLQDYSLQDSDMILVYL